MTAPLASPAPAEMDIARKVAFLRRVEAYPELPRRIEVVETHMSWVFLTDERAYKLKKPVRRDYLDFSTVEARRLNCLEELRLNRRLAPQVYRGVTPLGVDADGALSLSGKGEPVDWLVVMQRLPQHTTLDYRIRHGGVPPEAVERIVLTLAPFYRDAAKADIDGAAYCRRFSTAIALDRDKLLDPLFGLPIGEVAGIAAALLEFVDRRSDLLRVRAAGRRIVEAHGDLRPEHIFLLPEPTIIDCLEFNRAMRLLDPAEELAYLAMECAHIGTPWVGGRLLHFHSQQTGDRPDDTLLCFYRASRALLRARLSAQHLEDGDVREPERWRRQAAGYLALAKADAKALRQ